MVTNPDMLRRLSCPPPKWVKLFENLRYVVIDELHTTAGYSGATWATCCVASGECVATTAPTQFICCSATISKPIGAERLLEEPVGSLTERGTRGARTSSSTTRL